MQHFRHILLLLILFAVPLQGAAKSISGQDSVSVSVVGDETIGVQPGDVLTLAFRVEQSGSTAIRLSPQIHLPDGWRSLRPQGAVTVDPDAPTVRLISIHVPLRYLAGTYPVTFSILDPDRPEITSQVTASVSVSTLHELALDIDAPPAFVAAGKTLQSTLTVYNNGNAPADVLLSWDGSGAGTIDWSRREIEIASGASMDIPVAWTTDGDVTDVTTASYTITAQVIDHTDATAQISVRTDIIPLYEKLAARGTPVPLSLTIEAIGDDQSAQPVARFASTFDALDGNVEVVGTLANNSSQGLYGARNEIRVAYTSDKLDVVVGDQPQNLSPLTTWGIYRMGARSRVRYDEWDVTVLASRNRAYAPDDLVAGLSLKRHLSDASSLSTNALYREGLYTGSVATLAYDWEPTGARHALAAECGVSNLSDPSCRMETALARGPFRTRIEALSAASSLPGSRSGTQMISETMRVRLLPGLHVEESFQVQQRRSGTGSDRSSHVAKLGMTYAKRISGTTLSTTIQGTRDVLALRSPSQELSTESRMLRLTTGLQGSKIGLSATREIGRRLDSNQASSPVNRTRIQARLHPTPWLSMSLSADRFSDFLISSRIRQQYAQYGVRAGVQLPSRINLSLGGVQNHVSGRSEQTYRSLTFQASKQFESGSRAFVQSQSSISDGRSAARRVEFRLGVSMPLGIPNPRSSNTSDALIEGVVYHAVTGLPIENVLIRYGENMAISDAHGAFRLPRTEAGSWYLEVNQVSLPPGTVPLLEMPYLVGPDVSHIDLPIVASGTVEGHVVRLGPQGNPDLLYAGQRDSLIEKDRILGALIELRSGTRSWRTRTNQRGSFAFRGIPGGMYELHLISADRLPAYHTFRQDVFKIVVKGDSVTTRKFVAEPVKRTIRFQNTGQDGSLQLGTRSESDVPVSPAAPVSAPIATPMESVPDEPASTPTDSTTGRPAETRKEVTNEDQVGSLHAAPVETPVHVPPPTSVQRRAKSPFALLLLVLSALSYLLAADLALRHVMRMRHVELGNITTLHESKTLWHVRQGVLYGLVLVGVVATMGPLAGISATLGLSAVSVIIESWTAVQFVATVIQIRIRLLAKNRYVALYHGVIVDDMMYSHMSVRMKLKTGQSIVMSPGAAMGPAITFLWGAQETDLTVPVQCTANLVAVREDVVQIMQPFLHKHAADSLHISWEDTDETTTNVRVSAVTDHGWSQTVLEERLITHLAPYSARHTARILRLPRRAA